MTHSTGSNAAAVFRLKRWAMAAAMAAFAVASGPALAQPKGDASAKSTMEKVSGVWVEGPGFDINYGKTYEICAQRCLETPRCVMIEYYRPERKCNMYDSQRPQKTGGSSFVAIKR